IGPLCRLDPRFLPLLYNRRHLGVSTFLLGLCHGAFSLFQFHALGDADPLVSLFTANRNFTRLADFPFQPLGFVPLIILFLMAATSHDFWLRNLTPLSGKLCTCWSIWRMPCSWRTSRWVCCNRSAALGWLWPWRSVLRWWCRCIWLRHGRKESSIKLHWTNRS